MRRDAGHGKQGAEKPCVGNKGVGAGHALLREWRTNVSTRPPLGNEGTP